MTQFGSPEDEDKSSLIEKFLKVIVLVLFFIALIQFSSSMLFGENVTNCPKTITLLGFQDQPVKTYKSYSNTFAITMEKWKLKEFIFTDAATGETVRLQPGSYSISECLK